MSVPDRICQLCQSLSFRGSNELELQDSLEKLLRSHFSEVTREAKLSPTDRVDFLVERVAVEIKVDGSPMAVTRQLQKYLEHQEVDGVVLVTTRRKHLAVPDTLAGKPVRVVWLGPF